MAWWASRSAVSGALALPVGADGEDGQVVVLGTGQVVGVQFGVEDGEPLRPRAGDLGQVVVVPIGRVWKLGSAGYPQRGGALAGVVCTRPLAIACSRYMRK